MRNLGTVVTLLLCFVTLVASAELPLLPPIDQVQVESSEEAAPRMMSRLIRVYFRDQQRWLPFLDWSEENAPHTHHRVVREHRRGVKLPDVVQFHLRGNPTVEAPAAARGGL